MLMLFRRRPLDRSGGEAGRQRPIDRRGQTRVAGIDPVGVPARVHMQMQRDVERLAGLNRGRLGNQLRRDMRLRDRCACALGGRGNRLRGARCKASHNQKKEGEVSEHNRELHHYDARGRPLLPVNVL